MTRSIAALALAAALLVAAARPGSARLRVVTAAPGAGSDTAAVRPAWAVVGVAATGASAWTATGSVAAALLSAVAAGGLGLVALRMLARTTSPEDDPADLAAAWAQLALCLEIGLPVAAAAVAAAEPLEGGAGRELRRVAGLLALGADPAQAWHTVEGSTALAAFARAAGRSAGTGAALARAARSESSRLRAALSEGAEARAQRAAVLITAPLGLCFLPAFVALGIVPVVIGLAGEAVARW
jgi:pilus assembly protein TadC